MTRLQLKKKSDREIKELVAFAFKAMYRYHKARDKENYLAAAKDHKRFWNEMRLREGKEK